MAKILLIEDDEALSLTLKASLASKMHSVDHIVDGKEGLHWLEHEQYNAAIVDWDLPTMSGVDICKQFRDNGGNTPLLMLTGKGTLVEKVTGLDAGADDYLTKPFELDELHARLRSLLRRKETSAVQPSRISISDVELDTKAAQVLVAGKPIQLTQKEFGILELLMSNPNRTFDADAIMHHVWPSDNDTSPDIIRCHMTRLRSKLRKVSGSAGDLIKAIYGIGYKVETQ